MKNPSIPTKLISKTCLVLMISFFFSIGFARQASDYEDRSTFSEPKNHADGMYQRERSAGPSKTLDEIAGRCMTMFPADDVNLTINDIVEHIIGPGFTYTNVSYQGILGDAAEASIGLFTGGDCVPLGFDDGIIISSGSIGNAMGPNTSSSTSKELWLPGDPDLDGLIPGYTTYDATWIEFDFIPQYNQIYIQYVFGSEEYNQYVNSSFNDVFGFFVNGENIALLPDSDIPVAINNVNNGWASAGSSASGPCTNCEYFRDNANLNNPPYDIECDGMTTVLSATAEVIPGEFNTIKLAIADAGDAVYDSWVFIKAQSFHYNLGADFKADKTTAEVHETIQFEDLSEEIVNPVSWFWDFGDFSTGTNRYEQHPEHSYNQTGQYTVKLTITDEDGGVYSKTREDYINVVPKEEGGILLRIIETAPGNQPHIAKVGYEYTNWLGQIKNETFDVVDGYAHINEFQTAWHNWSSFNDHVILYDENEKRRGQIYFEYNPSAEGSFTRNAIIVFHNDDEITENGAAFPYGPGQLEYDEEWSYYQTGDYPVSMLVPPNNTFTDHAEDKLPLLLIHGWEGKYRVISNPDAEASKNEVSYWYTTAHILNNSHSPFNAWQFYYPYNSAHRHLALCLKSALDILKDFYPDERIRLVTHSMGGLVTKRYLVDFHDDANNKVEKVLFSAPPAHGSLGANLYYKTEYSDALQKVLGYDNHAPAVRDMKLGSDATWHIYNSDLPVLNGPQHEDYFVLLGTTYKWYVSDKRFQAYDKMGDITGYLTNHGSLHPEANNHHDGIVAISSGSLLNHGVGFATFYGNHNDAVHMQSFRKNSPFHQNIGDKYLLPNIIFNYFTKSYADFMSYLLDEQHIKAVVDGAKNVLKPVGDNIDLGNLDISDDDVNYQKGIINLEFSEDVAIGLFTAWYYPEDHNPQNNNMLLVTANHEMVHVAEKKGFFNRVINNQEPTNRYYFNDGVTFVKDNTKNNMKSLTYYGCATQLNQGQNVVLVVNESGSPIGAQTFDFNYCETVNVTVDVFNTIAKEDFNNRTDNKIENILHYEEDASESSLTSFYIDDQASSIEFRLSSIESILHGLPISMKMMLPDGSIADSTLTGSTHAYYPLLGLISMQVENPMPGEWQVWLESELDGVGSLTYNAVTHLNSTIHAYLHDDSHIVNLHEENQLLAGLEAPDIENISELAVVATVYRPDGTSDEVVIATGKSDKGNALIFELEYYFDLPGYHRIKYNIDGIYNGYHFERCLYQEVEAINQTPALNLPNFVLRQGSTYREVMLNRFLSRPVAADTTYFSKEIVSSTIDPEAFSIAINQHNRSAILHSNLADTGRVEVAYHYHFDDQHVSDTSWVHVRLPELFIENLHLSDSAFYSGASVVADYKLYNTGNLHSGSYEVKYFVSEDTLLLPSISTPIGEKLIHQHAADSIIHISDTLFIPNFDMVGDHYFLVVIDPLNSIIELDKSNNTAFVPVILNTPPMPPAIVATNRGNEAVRLTWTPQDEADITGYVIHHAKDTTDLFQKTYTFSNDTTHIISGLTNEVPYYFAVSSYRMMGFESELSELVSVTPTDSLFAPYNLFADMIAAESARLNWTPEGLENEWDIIYGHIGFDLQEEGIIIENIPTNHFDLAGLSSGTGYDFYVRARLHDDESEWSDPGSFFTNCIITATASDGGAIEPAGEVEVPYGSTVSFTFEADTGFELDDVLVDGESVGAVETYEFENVTQDHTIEALFELKAYLITASAGPGGSINPEGEVVVEPAGNQLFVIEADEGYVILDVLVDEQSVGAVETYEFENVIQDHTIEALFELKTYVITASAGPGGSINPEGEVVVEPAGNQLFVIEADEGYMILDVLVDEQSVGAVETYEFENVIQDHTIEALFELKTYVIAASAGTGGSIDPEGDIVVDHGSNQLFIIQADDGFTIMDVLVDNQSVGAVETYEFENVSDNHSILAEFMPDDTGTEAVTDKVHVYPNPFNNTINIINAAKLQSIVMKNIFGQIIFNEELNGLDDLVISTESQPGGVYILMLTGNDGSVRILKMIKE